MIEYKVAHIMLHKPLLGHFFILLIPCGSNRYLKLSLHVSNLNIPSPILLLRFLFPTTSTLAANPAMSIGNALDKKVVLILYSDLL